jgi:hypothetical protein
MSDSDGHGDAYEPPEDVTAFHRRKSAQADSQPPPQPATRGIESLAEFDAAFQPRKRGLNRFKAGFKPVRLGQKRGRHFARPQKRKE